MSEKSGWVETQSQRLKCVATIRPGDTPPERVDEGPFEIIGANGAIGRTDRANLQSPAVVVGRVGSAGSVNLVMRPAWVSDNGLIISPRDDFADVRFIAYALSLLDLQEDATQTAQPLITQTYLANRSIPAPSIARQRAVADFLDAETARIDALLATRERMIQLLEERSRALVSADLLPQTNEERAGAAWPWLLRLRHDVPLVPLGKVATVHGGITVDASREVSGEMVTRPYLRVANVQDGAIDLTEVSEISVPSHLAARTQLEAGDVLLTEGNGNPANLGRGAVWAR